MLLFELFAPFVTIVCVLVAVWLMLINSRTREDPPERQPDSLKPPGAGRPNARDTGGRRPSMSP